MRGAGLRLSALIGYFGGEFALPDFRAGTVRQFRESHKVTSQKQGELEGLDGRLARRWVRAELRYIPNPSHHYERDAYSCPNG